MTSPATGTPAAEGVKRLGTVISGRYLIRELLGEGGMGSVYLAEHTHMKKRVALKLLHPEMTDNAEVSARFEREAMASAHIEHPNVAAATDFGKTADGAFFLVLEYVEGASLRDALDNGALSVTRSLRIARQIGLALERAHDAGIVHRDLKPENVMLVKRENEPDFVKVLDFGIAKILQSAANASGELAQRNAGIGKPNEPLTRLGTILGTPEYMAPEQALGEAVTPAADLYGVGVMLYEMLTGKHPFEVPDRTAMLSFHIVAPVPLMQDRAPALDIPPVVEAVVRCLLEKEAKKRYANARALVEAIENAAAASNLDVGASPPAPPSHPGSGDPLRPGPKETDTFARTQRDDALPNAATVLGDLGALPPVSASFDGAASARGGGGAGGGETSDAKGRLLELLGRQPRPVLYAAAAGVPLLLVLVVVFIVVLARGPKPAGGVSGEAGAGGELARSKTAPPDRVKTATVLGPEALEALVKEFPEDTSLLPKLATAYHAQGKSTEAMRTVRTLVAADASAANDDEMVQLVATTAAKGQGEADDDAFALLEGPFGERGVDVLIELTAKGQGREMQTLRARATKSLAKPEVRAHASPAAAIYLDMKAAPLVCATRHDLLTRVKDQGDARMLPALKSFKATRGCGFLGRVDCWSCMRKDSALDDATAAVEARVSPK